MKAGCEPLDRIRLVIPVKRLANAKTRLSPHAPVRRAAAESLVTHTLQVATSCLHPRQIYVLTADPVAEELARRHGAHVLPDTETDLNSDLHTALTDLRRRDDDTVLVVLVADLPRLHPAELRHALAEAAVSIVPRHVADHHGTGTTFVSIPPGTHLPMVFGTGSAQHFSFLGSVPLRGARQGLRTDLDTPADPFQLDQCPHEGQLHSSAPLP